CCPHCVGLSNDLKAGWWQAQRLLQLMHWKTRGEVIVGQGKRHWRELKKLVYVDPGELQKGFKINCYGFQPIGTTVKPAFVDNPWNLFFRRMKGMIRFQISLPYRTAASAP